MKQRNQATIIPLKELPKLRQKLPKSLNKAAGLLRDKSKELWKTLPEN